MLGINMRKHKISRVLLLADGLLGNILQFIAHAEIFIFSWSFCCAQLSKTVFNRVENPG